MAWENRNAPRNGESKTPYQHKEGRGSIFDNDRKTEDKHPDFTGGANIGGVEYWVSAWKEMTKDGKKRKLSLSFRRQDEKPSEPRPTNTAQRASKW